ncbi:hypothetical protein [Undibacterium sp.]|uniref:hypothetical protein n=1 Tax=Undibacterium sp. TaxID=1914977 RepID=UPI002732220D|nr:hypothetical protein [Undibacterium sp.]MDP1976283.1 hypothetical protein [Undibacterium sp.]
MKIIKLISYLSEAEARALAIFVRSDCMTNYCLTLPSAADAELTASAGNQLARALADNGFLPK